MWVNRRQCQWSQGAIAKPLTRLHIFAQYDGSLSLDILMKIIVFLAFLAAGPAFGWSEPARGSADRTGMLDALRPHATWALGGPVEFMVGQLRMEGNLGFVTVSPQRPGGGVIDPQTTPMALRDPDGAAFMDGVDMQALLEKSGDTWVAVHWAIGATDVWFIAPELCAAYRVVLTTYCE